MVRKCQILLVLVNLFLIPGGVAKQLCQTQIIVTTPQTVQFYQETRSLRKNSLGVTEVGRWLMNQSLCYQQQYIYARTWDKHGVEHRFHSKQRYSNLNQVVTLQYPQDFTKVPKPTTAVRCHANFLNNSNKTIYLYAAKADPLQKIAKIDPFKRFTGASICFVNRPLVVLWQEMNGKKVKEHQYQSTQNYTNLNQPFISNYPQKFVHRKDKILVIGKPS